MQQAKLVKKIKKVYLMATKKNEKTIEKKNKENLLEDSVIETTITNNFSYES